MRKILVLIIFILLNTNSIAISDTSVTNVENNVTVKTSAEKKEEKKSRSRFLPFYVSPFIVILIVIAAKRRRQRKQQNQN